MKVLLTRTASGDYKLSGDVSQASLCRSGIGALFGHNVVLPSLPDDNEDPAHLVLEFREDLPVNSPTGGAIWKTWVPRCRYGLMVSGDRVDLTHAAWGWVRRYVPQSMQWVTIRRLNDTEFPADFEVPVPIPVVPDVTETVVNSELASTPSPSWVLMGKDEEDLNGEDTPSPTFLDEAGTPTPNLEEAVTFSAIQVLSLTRIHQDRSWEWTRSDHAQEAIDDWEAKPRGMWHRVVLMRDMPQAAVVWVKATDREAAIDAMDFMETQLTGIEWDDVADAPTHSVQYDHDIAPTEECPLYEQTYDATN